MIPIHCVKIQEQTVQQMLQQNIPPKPDRDARDYFASWRLC